MTSNPDFNGFPIASPGELCWLCLGFLIGYLRLLPNPTSLSALVDLMQMAQEMSHNEFHPMIEQFFIEARQVFQ